MIVIFSVCRVVTMLPSIVFLLELFARLATKNYL